MNNIKYSRRSFLRQNIAAGTGILLGAQLPLSSYAKTLHGDNQGEIPFPRFDLDNMEINDPIMRVVDLDIGEKVKITLYDGSKAQIKLLSLEEDRDPVFNTLAGTRVKVEINGVKADLECKSYRLPVPVGGLQVDVPAVKGFMADASSDRWMLLKKAARLRLWPAGSPWIQPGTFKYPVKQRWGASRTWFSNEAISPRVMGKVTYHAGMDFGGVDGLTEVVAATDGKIITLGNEVDDKLHPVPKPRYDVIYIEDRRGWIYRYSHLSAFDPALTIGSKVTMGQRLGYLGKEGSSGGWSHLHFHIESIQPSGSWAIENSYPFLWQSYIEEYDPKVIAVARPHIKTLPGNTVELDASHSWAKAGIRHYEWFFMDGNREAGAKVKRSYDRPGSYSEIIKITDNEGNVDYDFMRVDVYSVAQADSDKVIARSNPRVHAAYYPTFNIKPGDPVLFRSRGFDFPEEGGVDIYDFGDGSPKIEVPSNIDPSQHAANGYGTIIHHYKKPGNYIVRVDRVDEKTGNTASQHLHVIVNPVISTP